MQGKILTSIERIAVEELRERVRDKDTYMKLSVLILLDMGKGYEEIAIILGIGKGTITNCRQKFESEGLAKYLDKHYVPYSGRLDGEQLSTLDQLVSEGVYTTSQEIQAYISQAFGVEYSLSGVRAILHKLDFVYKKTTDVPSGANDEEQEAFLQELLPFLAEIGEDEAIFFVDAVHPQHNTRSTYAWIKKGMQKPVPTNPGRRRINLNGAMNAHRPEEVVIHEAPTIDAAATIALYEKLLAKYPDKKQIFVFGDNARYYRNEQLVEWLNQNPRIVQFFLPTYSPNLNLIERLWKFLRKKVINTRFYATFEEFRRAILHFFANLNQYQTELRSLITFNFQRLGRPMIAH